MKKQLFIGGMIIMALGFGQIVKEGGGQVRLSPRLLNYQGYLTDTLGNPITGSFTGAFAIYDAASAGNLKWSEFQALNVDKGIFHLLLGAGTSIPDSVFLNGADRWLEMTVASITLSPRTRIVSVPYAYTSTFSDTALYARNSAPDNDWTRGTPDSVLFTVSRIGLARGGANNGVLGTLVFTHNNFGSLACTTGTAAQAVTGCAVGGGEYNRATKNYGVVAGGYYNHADNEAATVSGGQHNEAAGMNSTVGGGYFNTANAEAAVVAGGNGNTASSQYGAVLGGVDNIASGHTTVVGGGNSNFTDNYYSSVLGGYGNTANNYGSAVGGGYQNYAGGMYSAIAGGYADTISTSAGYSYLFGINSNLTQDSTFMVDLPHVWFGTEAAGYQFPVSRGSSGQVMATNASGQLSWADQPEASHWHVTDSVLYTNLRWGLARGGAGNMPYGTNAFTHTNLGGYACTTGVTGFNYVGCAVLGGERNVAGGTDASIAGGYDNTASGSYSFIGGGFQNIASGQYSAVGSGYGAVASGTRSFVGSGQYCYANGQESYIGSGYWNEAVGLRSMIGTGWYNRNEGDYSVIAGGYGDTITATGDYSYLFGIHSKLTQDSTFMADMPHVWFGTEAAGYEFPRSRGTGGQVMATNASGQLSWADQPEASHWHVTDSVLYTNMRWGLARGSASNILYGTAAYTHTNLGCFGCTTGTSGQNYAYITIGSGLGNRARAAYSFIGGGLDNTADQRFAAVVFGDSNSALGVHSLAAAGYLNQAGSGSTDTASIVVGGFQNRVQNKFDFLGGGRNNVIDNIADYGVIGGGQDNTAYYLYNALLGGYSNQAGGNYSCLVGGYDNTIVGQYSFIGGGYQNYCGGNYAAVLNGYADTITSAGNYSYLFGINSNLTQDSTFMVDMPHVWFGTEVAGYQFPVSRGSNGQVMVTNASGQLSWANPPDASHWNVSDSVLYTNLRWGIARGGVNNMLHGTAAFTHTNLGAWACTTGTSGSNFTYITIGGGFRNRADSSYATAAGGYGNRAVGQYSFAGGGNYNEANSRFSATVGGALNVNDGFYSFIGGGYSNYVAGTYSAILGGTRDTIFSGANYSYLFGINSNLTQDSTFMVDMPHVWFGTEAAGYEFPRSDGSSGQMMMTNGSGQLSWVNCSNICGWVSSSVAIATQDSAKAIYRSGVGNVVIYSVGSGLHQINFGGAACTTGYGATNDFQVVSGGQSNRSALSYATIVNGRNNKTWGPFSAVVSGINNVVATLASDTGGVVINGIGNNSFGKMSFVGTGRTNTVYCDYGFVANGYNNSVTDDYSTIVNGANNSVSGYTSTIINGFYDTLASSADYCLAHGRYVYLNTASRVAFFDSAYSGCLGINRDDHNGGIDYPIHVGTHNTNGNSAFLSPGGIWSNGSFMDDRWEELPSVDGAGLLNKISGLQISDWRSRGSGERRISPQARDFYHAFGCGTGNIEDDSSHIAALDVAGVSLRAIQELAKMVRNQQAEIAELKAEIAKLKN